MVVIPRHMSNNLYALHIPDAAPHGRAWGPSCPDPYVFNPKQNIIQVFITFKFLIQITVNQNLVGPTISDYNKFVIQLNNLIKLQMINHQTN